MAAELRADPDLQAHLREYAARTGRKPVLVAELRSEAAPPDPDLVYPVGDHVFVHIHPDPPGLRYSVIEPTLRPEEVEVLATVKDRIFREASRRRPKPGEKLEDGLAQVFDAVVDVRLRAKLSPERRDVLRYHLMRDIARFGPIQPLTRDPLIEDIQAVGTHSIHIVHKCYGMLATNVRFTEPAQLDGYLRQLSERIGRPVSDARPIVDATLPDGSRINIVYAEDVSRKGPSFSVRRAEEKPVSVTQLIQWGTLSPGIAAYLWLCLENNMSIFVCGEAACGKSTTLNALLAFVDPRAKVFSAEDTPEIAPPHAVWQRLLTRETGPEDARVRMFDLLKAALRSRPNYIVVGEIRGAEGSVAFQAMQTGHPTVATFHAENKVKMIQRLTSEPINIPLTFVDNLNVAVFQQSVQKDGRLRRRVTSVDEIEGYSEFDGGIVTRPVFAYDFARDTHTFQGKNNSFILEKKVAAAHGWDNPERVYDELEHRTRILAALVERRVLDADAVNAILTAYHDRGEAALPFRVG